MTDAQYTHPRVVALYDALNPPDASTAFYEALVGQAPRRVLDLGCGTGLLARRLAAAGHDVTAVDPAEAMLDVGRRHGGRVDWRLGDARTLDLAGRYDVAVMTGHAFQVFVTDDDIAAVLATARRHATTFAFDTRAGESRPWERWTPRALPGVTVRYEVREVAGDVVRFATHHDFGDDVVVTESALRFLAADDLAARLRAAGFDHVEWYGDWDRGRRGPEIIAVAR